MRYPILTLLLLFSIATHSQDGLVGIGTSSPLARLQIDAINTQDIFRARINGSTRFLIFNNGGTGVGGTSSAPSRGLSIHGSTGMGIESPSAKLHISHNGTLFDPQLLLYESGATDYARLNFASGTSSTRWVIEGRTSDTNTDAELNFYNSDLESNIMSLRGDGVVGIGTDSPLARMQIDAKGAEDIFRARIEGSTKFLVFNNGGTGVGGTSSAPSNGLSVSGSGGFGEESPTDKLHVNSAAGQNAMRVQVNGSTKFRVFDSGGVAFFSTADPGADIVRFNSSGTDLIISTQGSGVSITPSITGSGSIGFSNRTFNSMHSVSFVGTLVIPSDRQFKERVRPIDSPFAILGQFDGKKYAYKKSYWYEQTGHKVNEVTRKNQYGFIAQEVEEFMPEIVNTDEEGNKGINYTALIPILVEAVNDLKAENEELRAMLKTHLSACPQGQK